MKENVKNVVKAVANTASRPDKKLPERENPDTVVEQSTESDGTLPTDPLDRANSINNDKGLLSSLRGRIRERKREKREVF